MKTMSTNDKAVWLPIKPPKSKPKRKAPKATNKGTRK